MKKDEYKDYITQLYDEYLMKTENRGISWGELAYIDGLTMEELKELENGLNNE